LTVDSWRFIFNCQPSTIK